MSLSSFVRNPEVRAKLAVLRPKFPRKIPVELRVEPRSNRYTVVGTAFDYLLRFDLQRRAPHALAQPLVAEFAPGRIWRPGFFMYLSEDWKRVPPEEAEELAKQLAQRTSAVVESSKAAITAFVKLDEPDRVALTDLAGHAIRLAKLDEMCRAIRLNPTFEEADPEDVQDLLELLALVPFSALIHPQIVLLNPTFGEASIAVGGADADLITGDMLVDLKTTGAGEMQAADLDQLLGYFLLARKAHRSHPAFPAVSRLAIYYARHGYLWQLDARLWTEQAEFAELEGWFFERAKGVFVAGLRKAIEVTAASDPR
jgi:hypothetical protein